MFQFSDLVTAQDLQVCEEVQRNLEAGIYQGGVTVDATGRCATTRPGTADGLKFLNEGVCRFVA